MSADLQPGPAAGQDQERTITLMVEDDHVSTISKGFTPLQALSELIWNSLDADAKNVEVRIERNDMGGLESVTIQDDGHGFTDAEASHSFQNLGGSRKRVSGPTPAGRSLHGRKGHGRISAFRIGGGVEWVSRVPKGDTTELTRVHCHVTKPKEFTLRSKFRPGAQAAGTRCRIEGINSEVASLLQPGAMQSLARVFALYLKKYPGIRISVNREVLDPSAWLTHEPTTLPFVVDMAELGRVRASLTILEWNFKTERVLHLCDENGFTLDETAPGIQARGFDFTAYVSSDFLKEQYRLGNLGLLALSPALQTFLDVTKNVMRSHFRRREAELAAGLVERWKEEKIYPYEGAPRDLLEATKREVFDIVASRVEAHSEDFRGQAQPGRRMSFQLLRAAIEAGPEDLLDLLGKVINLPAEEQSQLHELLQMTSLEAVIRASKAVATRLSLLSGLNTLLFSAAGRENTLERKHLHRIVADNAWIFGERFQLSDSDADLTNVLRRHLGESDVEILDGPPVLREDGSHGIVDLVLGRTIPLGDDTRENLVVELKRPNVQIDQEAVAQIKSYARAIARDERFDTTRTKWTFWAISNSIAKDLEDEFQYKDRPGLILTAQGDRPYEIYVRTWAQILENCHQRMRFFSDRFAMRPTDRQGLEFLRRTYLQFIPPVFHEEPSQGDQADPAAPPA